MANVLISGVRDGLRARLIVAVSAALAGRPDSGELSVVLLRLVSGEWTLFITDGAKLELVDPELTERVLRAVKDAERSGE
jgi:hypothetical protein